jgi:hypothetical protein
MDPSENNSQSGATGLTIVVMESPYEGGPIFGGFWRLLAIGGGQLLEDRGGTPWAWRGRCDLSS